MRGDYLLINRPAKASLIEPRLRQPFMPLSVLAVVILVMPVFVLSVMPLVGSFPAPIAVIGIEASDGQAQYGRADGQAEKTSFHGYSRVGLGGLPCTSRRNRQRFRNTRAGSGGTGAI